jgi:DNA-binding phage protein
LNLQVYEFDPALYLTDRAAIDAYLEHALQTGCPGEIEEARAVAARAFTLLQSRELDQRAPPSP